MRILLLVFAMLLPLVAGASVSEDITYGPWVTAVSGTDATVIWLTSGKSLDTVQVMENEGSPFCAEKSTGYCETIAGRRVNGTLHTVHLDGLKPGTQYIYRITGQRVEDDSNPYDTRYAPIEHSECFSFRTLNPDADSCRFAMLNDIHGDKEMMELLSADVKAEDFDFLMLCGDLVSYINDGNDFLNSAIAPISGIAAEMPIHFARGNHETRGSAWYTLRDFFPTHTSGFWYTFRQGPVAFVVLDAGEDKPDNNIEYSGTAEYDKYRAEETKWLETAVKDSLFADAPFKVALIHIPAFINQDSWYGEMEAARLFNPVLETARVDLMLSAHCHKHIFCPVGEASNPFPIIINSNEERLDFKADADRITLVFNNLSGQTVHTYEIRK